MPLARRASRARPYFCRCAHTATVCSASPNVLCSRCCGLAAQVGLALISVATLHTATDCSPYLASSAPPRGTAAQCNTSGSQPPPRTGFRNRSLEIAISHLIRVNTTLFSKIPNREWLVALGFCPKDLNLNFCDVEWVQVQQPSDEKTSCLMKRRDKSRVPGLGFRPRPSIAN